MKICSIESCDSRHYSKGWCRAHYMRQFRHGDPMSGGTARGEPAQFIRDAAYSHQDIGACLTWPYSRNNKGYGTIIVNGRIRIASRIMCEAAHGVAPTPKHEAAHSCGNGGDGCVNPNHLRWATKLENAADRQNHGTGKLTDQQVLEIFELKGVEEQQSIAARYGVHYSMVSLIHSGLRRQNVIAELS